MNDKISTYYNYSKGNSKLFIKQIINIRSLICKSSYSNYKAFKISTEKFSIRRKYIFSKELSLNLKKNKRMVPPIIKIIENLSTEITIFDVIILTGVCAFAIYNMFPSKPRTFQYPAPVDPTPEGTLLDDGPHNDPITKITYLLDPELPPLDPF